jgi:hypothetical protein
LQWLDAAQIEINAGTDVQAPNTGTYGNYNLTIAPPYALEYPGTSNLGWKFYPEDYKLPNRILYPSIIINNEPQSCNGNKSCP